MMGLTIHLYFIFDAFSFYRVSFSLMVSLKMMVLGPGHLVHALFHFALEIPLVVSIKYFPLFVSEKYFQLIESQNTLVVLVEYFPLVLSVDYL